MSPSSPNTRTGLIFFAVYFIFYTGFVLVSAFDPSLFEQKIGGVTLAVVAGMGLIFGAIGWAVTYCWICREKPASRGEPRAFRLLEPRNAGEPTAAQRTGDGVE